MELYLLVDRCLQMDRDEIESLRQARLLEEEKAQYSVRRQFGCSRLHNLIRKCRFCVAWLFSKTRGAFSRAHTFPTDIDLLKFNYLVSCGQGYL